MHASNADIFSILVQADYGLHERLIRFKNTDVIPIDITKFLGPQSVTKI